VAKLDAPVHYGDDRVSLCRLESFRPDSCLGERPHDLRQTSDSLAATTYVICVGLGPSTTSLHSSPEKSPPVGTSFIVRLLPGGGQSRCDGGWEAGYKGDSGVMG
jgi:hypothetical protein